MKRETFNVLLLLLLALVIRIGFLLLAGVNAPPVGDELAYQQIAEHFAAGQGLFQTNNPFFPGEALYAWQAPLYPLTLGILYAALGSNLLWAKLFGVLLSTATVYVTYDLTRRVFHSRRIALVAGLLVAIYPGFLTQAHLLLSETLFIFLLLLAFDFAARAFEANARLWLWLAGAGALWGLATLTRGITLYFAPLFALWCGWMIWKNVGDDRDVGDRRHTTANLFRTAKPRSPLRGLAGAGLFLLCAALVIAPWTARNYARFGQLVLLETKGGVNLWLGNSPDTPDDFIRNVWKTGIREPILNVLPPGELARDRAAYALALNHIRAAPLTFGARMPIKFADFWSFERNLIDNAEATRRGVGWQAPAKLGADLLSAIVYMFILLCGTAGFIFASPSDPFPKDAGASASLANTVAPRRAYAWLFGGFTLYFVAAHLVLFGDGRFHLPLIPFFAMYAAWLLVMFRQVKFSTPRLLVTLLCGGLLVAVWLREAAAALQVLRGG